MVIINGIKFAENESEFTNSLFVSGGTCFGYAKRLKNSIKLYNAQKEIIGIISAYGVIGSAMKLDNGKLWFSYANIKVIGELDTSEIAKICENLSVSSCYTDNGKKYQYKN